MAWTGEHCITRSDPTVGMPATSVRRIDIFLAHQQLDDFLGLLYPWSRIAEVHSPNDAA
jgi:hypothetical protein